MQQAFRRIAERTSAAVGSSWAFVGAVLLIVAWAVAGPFMGFSDTWQLVCNTATTIITFLMIFLVQNTQNRSDKATQLKLDELLRASAARNDLIDAEHMSDDDLRRYQQEFDRRRREGLL